MRQAAPAARLIVDANESWNERQLGEYMPMLVDLRVALIEQPLPADADDALARLERPIPLCADESCRTLADLDRLDGKYQAINIKLDKAGGLTEALALAAEAKRRGLRIMVGGVISTSLGIAPALLVAQQAEIVDLDGPLRLALDRGAGLRYDGSTIHPADPKLWGGTWLMLEHRPVNWSAGPSYVSFAPALSHPTELRGSPNADMRPSQRSHIEASLPVIPLSRKSALSSDHRSGMILP